MRRAAASLLLLAACGGEPDTPAECFAGTPRPVEIVIDPSLVATTLAFECSGSLPTGESVCNLRETVIGRISMAAGPTTILIGEKGFSGWELWIEVGEDDGRVCLFGYTDVSTGDEPYCIFAPPTCAAGGLVTLSRRPTDDTAIAVAVDVRFENGATIVGSVPVE